MPLETAIAWPAPANEAKASSNSSTLGPMLHQPRATASLGGSEELLVDEEVGQRNLPHG